MMLHHSKRIALINSLNCISSNDLEAITDLKDGKSLLNILNTTFKESFNNTENGTTDVSNPQLIDVAVNKSTDAPIVESKDVEMKSVLVEKSVQDSTVESVESPEDGDKIIFQRFELIKNFINERYSLKSEDMITYTKCMQGDEFELAKVAVFILSEVVRHFVDINNDQLKTLAHLDVRIQEDLQECFYVFIFEREILSGTKIQKVLSNHAKYKSRSPLKSPFTTPRRNCVSKYKLDFPSTPPNEDVYTNSPLKSFFESPIFRKEDIIMKEKEIAKTRKILHEEELKSEDLQFELKEVKKKLKEKDKEITKLKITIKSLESDTEKLQQNYEDQLKEERGKIESLIKKCKEYEVKYSRCYSTITLLMRRDFVKGKVLEYRNGGIPLEDQLLQKDEALIKLRNIREKLSEQVQSQNEENRSLNKKLETLESQLLEMKDQNKNDRELHMAKLSEIKQSITNVPESPIIGENLGVIIEEENRHLRWLLDQKESEIIILRKKNEEAESKMKDLEIKVKVSEIKQEVKSVSDEPVEKHQICLKVQPEQDVPSHENNALNSLGKEFENVKELTESSTESDLSIIYEVKAKNSPASSPSEHMSSVSEVVTKHSPSSCMELVPFNTPGPVSKRCGKLWENCENSHSETESAGYNTPENCYTPDNFILFQDPQFDMPKKNGYKLNVIEYMKMVKEQADQLKKKEEDIEKLEATCATLEQKSKDYLARIKENNETIEGLGNKLDEKDKICKAYITRCAKYKSCLIKEREQLMKYNDLCEKLTQMEFKRKKREEEHKYEVENLKTHKRKKEQEIECLKIELLHLNKMNKNLEKNLFMLNREKKQLLTKLNETKLKLLNVNVAEDQESIKEQSIFPIKRSEAKTSNYRPQSFYVDLNAGAPKDTCNESTLSVTLGNKSGLQFISQDEDDFVNQSSLEDIKRDRTETDDRTKELLTRNSLLPQHLQSSYPLEMDLPLPTEKFYIKDSWKNQEIKPKTEQVHCRKKRKHDEDEDAIHSSEVASTPVSKIKRTFKTPSSLKKLLHFSRNHRKGPIKPKPH